jgi:hypothetical protein
METFEEKVERYMQCDKRTLAEMLAMKDFTDLNNSQQQTVPYYDQLEPNIFRPARTYPMPPNYGDWVVTCSIN